MLCHEKHKRHKNGLQTKENNMNIFELCDKDGLLINFGASQFWIRKYVM